MEHPFWRTRFLLTNHQDLTRFKETNIQEVWIDTDKGDDVQGNVLGVTEHENQEEIDHFLMDSVAERQSRDCSTSIAVEQQRAKRILKQSRKAVTALFGEMRLGRAMDTSVAETLVQDISGSLSRHSRALLALARLARERQSFASGYNYFWQ